MRCASSAALYSVVMRLDMWPSRSCLCSLNSTREVSHIILARGAPASEIRSNSMFWGAPVMAWRQAHGDGGNLDIPKKGIIIPNMGSKKRSKAVPRQPHSGVADALFTKVQQRVLAVLFGNPSRSFYANEIIAMARTGTGAVQRELAHLEAAGLVTVVRVGNQKHYQANANTPVFKELRSLVLKTSGLADILRAALAPSADKISTAFVYGSIAKGEDTAKSDIDLMVISDTLSYPDLYASLEEATRRLGRTVNPTVYKPQDLDKRFKEGNAFIQRVMAQPKIWLMGEKLEPAT